MTVETDFCIILNEKLYGSFSVTHNSLSQILDQISQISLRLTNNGIKFQSQSDVITVITLTFSAFFFYVFILLQITDIQQIDISCIFKVSSKGSPIMLQT